MADTSKDLRAGFTGAVNDDKLRIAERARSAANSVRDEANAVAETARLNPTVTGTALLAVGVIGFILGHIAGSASTTHRSRYWG